jgi:hypothetical protein
MRSPSHVAAAEHRRALYEEGCGNPQPALSAAAMRSSMARGVIDILPRIESNQSCSIDAIASKGVKQEAKP